MKRYFEWLAILLIGVLAFFAYQAGWVHQFRNFISLDKPVAIAVPLPEAEVLQRKNDTEPATDTNSPVANIDLNEIQLAADAHIAKYSGWRQSRGQFVSRELGDYKSYGDEVLTSLAKQGDLKASMVLMNRYLDQGKMRESIHIANIATVFGSTWGLYLLSDFAGPSFAPKEHARTAALESLAIARVMDIRGDSELAESVRSDLVRRNRADLNLTAEEKSLVNQRADQIYLKFQAIRTAKGLGDFDNTPSPFAKTQ